MPVDRLELHTNPFLNNTEVDFNNQENCCTFIIDHGANANGTDPDSGNMMPLHIALWTGYNRIAESLIRAGANINAVSAPFKWTPLTYAYNSVARSVNGKEFSMLFSGSIFTLERVK